MFQNQKSSKLKQNPESQKQRKKNSLKLHKVEERNKEKIELMKEKINFIHEKLSAFKDSVTSKNKNASINKRKIVKTKSIKELDNKQIKQKDLLSTINISPNFQHINDFKLPYHSFTNNFYIKCQNIQTKIKNNKEKSLDDSKYHSNNDKDYLNKKKKDINNKLNIYDSTNREYKGHLKDKGNYSRDKENTSHDKITNFNSFDIYDKNSSSKRNNNLIHSYKKLHNKNKNNKEFSLLDEIMPNKSSSFSYNKIEKEENICLNSNKTNSLINRCQISDKLGIKGFVNLSKETPSTKNTIKNEIKIPENVVNNKYNKISNGNETSNIKNKIDSLNNKNENPKKIRIIRCLSKTTIIDKKSKRNNNRSFEYKHKLNLNLSQLRNINIKRQKKISKELNQNKNNNKFLEKNLFSITSPKSIGVKYTMTKSLINNNSKNIITLRKPTHNCKIEIPYEQINPQKNKRKKYEVYNKHSKKKLNHKKHSSFNASKTINTNFSEKQKYIHNKKHKLKTEKLSKKFQNKSCENLSVFNFKTIQSNFNENEKDQKKEKKIIPHVFSVILKRKGLNQKEYPNMALRMNSSEENINTRKNLLPVYKEMKLINEVDYICKKGFSGPGIKKTNQDNFFIFKNFLNNKSYLYLGVCDGHGIFGQDISSYLVNNLPQNLNSDLINQNINNISSEKFDKIKQNIETSFIQTNIKLNTDERIDSTYSGSTCSSIIYTPKKLISINVGDSRCILGKCNKQNWFPKILTRDHKPNLPDEFERIISSGGKVEPYRDSYGNYAGPDRVWKKDNDVPGLAMSRSFGDEIGHEVGVIVNPEINEYEFVNEDKFIVIASDGIWEFISNEEVVKIVKDFYVDNDIKGALNFLYKEASKRWIMEEEIIDDITIILIFLKN